MSRKDSRTASVVRPASTPAPSESTLATRTAWCSIVAAVVLVPLTLPTLLPLGIEWQLMNDPFSLSKLVALRVITLIALGAWGFDLFARGGRIRHTPVEWLILGFLGWVGLTTVTAIHVPTALVGKYFRDEGFLTFVNYVLIYFLTLQVADRAARVRMLALALFGSSVVVSAYGVLQYFALDPAPWMFDFAQRAFSTYGNPNILGGYLMFSLPVGLGLALAEKDVRRRLALWSGVILNAFALLFTFTRGAWIGAVVAVVIMAMVAIRTGVRLTRVDAASVSVAAGLAGLLLFIQSRIETFERVLPVAQMAGGRLTEDPGGVGGRLLIWQAALSAIRERPVLGYGSDSLRFVFPRHKPVEYLQISDNVADSPHNYPLQLAVGSGIVGALLFYAVIAWAALRSAPLVFKRSDDPNRIVYGSFWAACAGYVASLMFGLSIPGVTFLLWMSMAILLAPTAASVPVRAPRWGQAAGVALAIACAAGIVLQAPVLAADRAYLQATRADAGAAAPAAAAKAVRLNPLNHAYREHWGFSYLNEALRQLSEAERAASAGSSPASYLQTAERNLQTAERVMRDTIAWNPEDAATYQYLTSLYNLRGDLLGRQGDYELALKTATTARVLDPWSVALRFETAYALRALGRTDEAVSELQDNLEILPGHVRSALLLAGIYEQAGDRDAALGVLREANEARPDQPSIVEAVRILEGGGSLLGGQ